MVREGCACDDKIDAAGLVADMERDPGTTALVATLVSLGAHAALILLCAEVYARSTRIYEPGFAAGEVQGPDDIVIDRSGDLGDREGIGFATNGSPGAIEQLARRSAVDQALVSRDPVGAGRVGDLPSMSVEPQGQSGGSSIERASQTARHASIESFQQPVELPAFGARPLHTPLAEPTPDLQKLHQQIAQRAQQEQQQQEQEKRHPEEQRQQSSVALARPGASKPPADPAPMSESEVDPFSKTGGVEFRKGKMDVRFGRSFKSVRPRLSTAAQLDLLSIRSPRIVLKIAIDESGKVTKVDVLRSSGSKIVDQPVTVALYQWWFEPAKNADGKPIADELVLPITWR